MLDIGVDVCGYHAPPAPQVVEVIGGDVDDVESAATGDEVRGKGMRGQGKGAECCRCSYCSACMRA